jgi:hypothetical protein
VRNPGVSIATPDTGHPFSKYSCIDEGIAPEHIGNTRMCPKERPNFLV